MRRLPIKKTCVLVPLTVVALGLLLHLGCDRLEESSPSGKGKGIEKVFVMGIDAADWNIVDPLIKQGKLRNLEGLVERGVRARLKTVSPILSPVVWTSIVTGMKPSKHGIIDFLATNRETGEMVPVTSNLRKVKALWSILSDHDVSVGFTGLWATWPAEPVEGYMVTDRVSYQLFGYGEGEEDSYGKTYPADLYDEILPLRVKPGEVDDDLMDRFIDGSGEPSEREGRLIEELRAIVAQQLTYHRVSLYLRDKYDPVVDFVYFEGVDTVGHLFMPYRPPRLPWIEESSFKRFSGAVDEFYRWTDELLGEQLATLELETRVVVLSDHGFRTGRDRPPSDSRIGYQKAAEWHRKYGILVMAGRGIKKGKRISQASILDVTPTLLYLCSLPSSREMDGKVIREAMEEELLEDSPPATVETFEDLTVEKRSEEPVPSPADRSIREKLLALGYISPGRNGRGEEAGAEPAQRGEEGFVLDNPNAVNNRALILLNRGKIDGAVELLEPLTRDHPEFLSATVQLAYAYFLKGDYDGSLSGYGRALELEPANPAIHNYRGNVLMAMEDFEGAEKAFLEALALYPDFTDAHNSLGILYESKGDYESARKEYERVIAVDPEFAEAYNNIGNLYKNLGDYDAAEEKYREAIEADPDFYGSYNNLGVVLQLRGRYEEALPYLEKASDLNPADVEIRNNRGTLLLRMGRMREAREVFKKLIEDAPEYAEAYNNLGVLYGKLGRREEELQSYREAVAARPDYFDARYNLALALLRAGRIHEAIEEFERSLLLDDRNRAVLENLYRLYSRTGNRAKAESIRMKLR